MKELIDNLILRWGHDPATWPITQGLYLAGMMLAGIALTTFGAIFAGLLSWWERRVAARIQSRIGPNRVGPGGLLQFLADALKLIGKEDLIPGDSDKLLFRIAPYFVMTGFVLTFVVLPFGYRLSPSYMNVGLFYVVPIITAGSLNLHDIIRAQGGAPWDWFMFQTPMGYGVFFILFVSLLAEGNRTPFDLPEAESELVSGYNTEYSGMRFAYFFTAEWGGLWVSSALLTTL